MAYYLSLLLLTALTIIYPHLFSATPSSSPPSPDLQQCQLNNIIDALIGAGDFGSLASIISSAEPSTFPFTVTLFIPTDDALSHLPTTPPINFDPFVFPYHIVPQRLSFSDLQLFKLNSRLPTLLPNKSILITNNSHSNFTVDDSPITHPDLYITATISVHGIGAVLDSAVYGDKLRPPTPLPPKVDNPPPPPMTTTGGTTGGGRSDAACLCTEFSFVISVVCAAFAFKMHGNPLTL